MDVGLRWIRTLSIFSNIFPDTTQNISKFQKKLQAFWILGFKSSGTCIEFEVQDSQQLGWRAKGEPKRSAATENASITSHFQMFFLVPLKLRISYEYDFPNISAFRHLFFSARRHRPRRQLFGVSQQQCEVRLHLPVSVLYPQKKTLYISYRKSSSLIFSVNNT